MNASAGYSALRERAAWIALPGHGLIRATGEDRIRFLHAMSTNHVQQLVSGGGCYTFFLTAQGRIVADANLYRLPGYLFLDAQAGSGPKLFEHLDRYVIADDVTLADVSNEMEVIAVEGPDAADLAGKMDVPVPPADGGVAEWGTSLVARVAGFGLSGLRFYLPSAEKPRFIQSLSNFQIPEASPDEANTVRLENGIPQFGLDFTEGNLVQETRLMHAVHFSKGCYIGQEIVERVRSRGHVNRQLRRLRLPLGKVPEAGAHLTSQEKEAGVITSAAESPALGAVVALGMLRTEAAAAKNLTWDGTPVELVEQPVESRG